MKLDEYIKELRASHDKAQRLCGPHATAFEVALVESQKEILGAVELLLKAEWGFPTRKENPNAKD